MLTISGTPHGCCAGITRRDVLKIGALGCGLGLSDLLRLRARADNPGRRPRSVIMAHLWGGIWHIDTYDMKPKAPAEFRGEFKPSATNVPGLDLCELLPLHAKIADQFSLVRGLRAYSREHGAFEQITGANEEWKPRRPAIGSVLSRLRGEGPLPHFVNLAVTAGNVQVQHDPSYLGAAHRPFIPSGAALANLTLRRMSPERLGERRDLLQSFDSLQRERDAKRDMTALDAFQSQAMEMILAGQVRDALDVSREPDKLRAKYALAPQLLAARRLVEAGVSLVSTLLAPPASVASGSWDTHSDNFNFLRRGLPVLDSAVHTLLTDLHERGLDDDVLVVVWGEFGRSPRINREGGRDHWASTNCALLAGGGLQMGKVVGDSGPRGETDPSGKYTPQTMAALIYHALGIDPAATLPDPSGRPIYLVEDRDLIPELV